MVMIYTDEWQALPLQVLLHQWMAEDGVQMVMIAFETGILPR